jgi:glycine cleavage system transcriptional repressor
MVILAGEGARSYQSWRRIRTPGPPPRQAGAAALRAGATGLGIRVPTGARVRVNWRPVTQARLSMQFIVISALGSDRTGLVYDLTRVVLDCSGNIVDSRMSSLGSEFAMLLLVSGNWHTLAKLETELKKLSDSTGITVSLRRTDQRPPRKDVVTYSVDVVCLDQPGIVHNLAGFFSARGIDIAELNTRSYAAAHTGAPMFSVQMVVHIPGKIHIAALREEFMDLCDQLNLDAILEPVKS